MVSALILNWKQHIDRRFLSLKIEENKLSLDFQQREWTKGDFVRGFFSDTNLILMLTIFLHESETFSEHFPFLFQLSFMFPVSCPWVKQQ